VPLTVARTTTVADDAVMFTGVTYQRPAAGFATVTLSLPPGVVPLACAWFRGGAKATPGTALPATGAGTRAKYTSTFDALAVVTASCVAPAGTSMNNCSWLPFPARRSVRSSPLTRASALLSFALRVSFTGKTACVAPDSCICT
jgi:hypothetical protein